MAQGKTPNKPLSHMDQQLNIRGELTRKMILLSICKRLNHIMTPNKISNS